MNNNHDDNMCSKCCLCICNALRKICFPIHFICKYLMEQLARPYSFFLLMSFFIIIIPFLLLIILLIQNSSFIHDYSSLSVIYYFLLIFLTLNFFSTYYIYYLYGVHSLDNDYGSIKKKKHNVQTYFKFILNYLFITTKLGFLILYYLIQLVIVIICVSWFNQDIVNQEKKLNQINIYKLRPVIIYFMNFGLTCDLIFLLSHIFLYFFLFNFILCKINQSCICSVMYYLLHDREETSETKKQDSINIQSQYIQNNSLNIKEKVEGSTGNTGNSADSNSFPIDIELGSNKNIQNNIIISNNSNSDISKEKPLESNHQPKEDFYDIGLKFYDFIGLFDYIEAFEESEIDENE